MLPRLPSAPAGYHTGALLALAGATFGYVTSETLPVGLLPQISSDLSVSAGQVGLLLTAYAFVAAVTAIPLTAWTTGMHRDRLILAVLLIFVLSQFGAAAAPNYACLMGARVVCALGHGLFWSIVAPIATRLAPPGHAGRATAAVFIGNSLALVAGLPLGTLLGQLGGWRVAFLLTGGFATVTLLTLRRVLPALPGAESAGFSPELLRRLARPHLLAVYAITIALVIGQFAAYSYLAPIVQAHGGITGSGYSALLLVYGALGLVAVVVLGRLVDSHPRRSFAVPMATIAIATAVLSLVGHSTVLTTITVLAWGGAFTAIPVMLQAAVLRWSQDPDVASAVYVVAFQIGIGGGAALGGVLVDGGHLDASIAITTVGATLGLVIGVCVRGLFPRRPSAPAEAHLEVAQHE